MNLPKAQLRRLYRTHTPSTSQLPSLVKEKRQLGTLAVLVPGELMGKQVQLWTPHEKASLKHTIV